jgi:1-acyl-sn-glycerol-3-phosphate acyltransferase
MTRNKRILEQGWRFTLTGVLRVAGFFSLIFILLPFHLFTYVNKSLDPHRFPLLFHKGLVRLLGFKLRVHGKLSTAKPTLFVANHSSYLDVPVLGSLIPAAFVAKSEVAHWPVIGIMARLQHTVFIERKAARVGEQSDVLRANLEKRKNMVLFAEGTSSDGTRTLPFKSSLFSIVEDPLPNGAPIMVQPVTILCTELGGLPISRAWRPYYAWYGDMTLMRHLWNVFRLGHFTVDVVFHPPVAASAFPNRKALSTYCQRQVARGVELCVTGRVGSLEFPPQPPKKALAPPAKDLAQTGS